MRPKIVWLAYGKSSIYKCNRDHNYSDENTYWFYTYNNNDLGSEGGSDQFDEGHWVFRCTKWGMSYPGYVVKRLKSNTEQCLRVVGEPPEVWNQWEGSSECVWYVKPRIKIPIGIADETEVCRIEIIDQDGNNKIPPVSINAIHFKDNQGQYNGDYREEFYLDGPNNPPRGIYFQGDLGYRGDARGTSAVERTDQWANHADFRVWWSNNCNMWIDYVKVEDDVADQLMADPPKLLTGTYNQWIQQEVDAVINSSHPESVYNFYIELPRFNNIRCMGYLNKKIQQYSGG